MASQANSNAAEGRQENQTPGHVPTPQRPGAGRQSGGGSRQGGGQGLGGSAQTAQDEFLFDGPPTHPKMKKNGKKIISLYDLENVESKEDGHAIPIDNRILVGCLLAVKYNPAQGAAISASYRSLSSRSFGASAKQAKIANTSYPYRRLFTFLDVNTTSGKCFVVVEGNSEDEKKLWAYNRESFRVGDFVMIEEPHNVDTFIGGSIPIVRTDNPFRIIYLPSSSQNIKEIAPRIDTTEEMCGFLFSNVRAQHIQVSGITAIKAICAGFLCDRQVDPSHKGNMVTGCGCYTQHRTQSANIVLKMSVSLNKPESNLNNVVVSYLSWRTTNLIFNPPMKTGVTVEMLRTHKQRIREVFLAISDFIDERGGWTIIGWYKSGTKQDASAGSDSGASSLVQSDEIGYHISYMFPSNKDVLTDGNFKALQIDPSTLIPM